MSHPGGVDPLIGKVIDERYRVEAQLGEGGIGRVYTARHITLGRLVALKVLLTRYGSVDVLKQRFQREAEALAALNHPNIVTVTDFGVTDNGPYIVMELLEGTDLAELIAGGEPIEPRRGLRIVRQMLRALAYAHEQQLVHRDLKPHNVFIRPLGPDDDHVEVLDFGLARFLDDAWKNAPKLTAQGALIGTPAYMAPEQASGEEVDARADVYAAGLVIFEVLTGRRAFEEADPGQMLRAHLLKPPPTIRSIDPGLDVDPALEQFVARALSKSPSARFDDGAAMLEAFDELGPEPVRRVGPRPVDLDRTSSVAPTQISTRGTGPRVAPTSGSPAGGTTITLPQNKMPLFFGAGLVALLLMGAGAGVVYLVMRSSLLETDTTAAPPPPPTLPEPEPGSDPTSEAPARDPFAGEIPELLRTIQDAVENDEEVTRAQLSQISVYQNDGHEEDPLPHLLLAHINTDGGRLRLALLEYRTAYDTDATIRGDPYMLPDLVIIARDEAQNEAASELIHEAFSDTARAEIVRALLERMPHVERHRLEALRDSFRAPEVDQP